MAETTGSRVKQGDDGKYRWVYEMSLWKNPTVFILIWKIFFFIILGIFAFIVIFDIVDWGEFSSERFFESLKFCGYFVIGMTVVVGISYAIYAAVMGGKYVVEFTMDEKGVRHRQLESQAKKGKTIGKAAAAASFATGRLSAVGTGVAAQRSEMYSAFSKTRKVKAYPGRNLIKVNEVLNHNQVYAQKEDFDFVKDYIISHCENLKKR